MSAAPDGDRGLVGAMILIVTMVAVTVGRPWDLALLALLALGGLVSARRSPRGTTPREWKPWYAAVIAWCVLALGSAADLLSGLVAALPLILILPIPHLVASRRVTAASWWWAVSAAALSTGIVALTPGVAPDAEWLVRGVVAGVLAVTGLGWLSARGGAAWTGVPIAALVASIAALVQLAPPAAFAGRLLHDAWHPDRCVALGVCAEYIAAWRDGGLPALLASAFLLITPGARFAADAGHPDRTVRQLALSGLALVLITLCGAILWPVFSAASMTAFYAAAVAFLLSVRHLAERAWYARPVSRSLSLAATVICKNEEDRIGECLESLAGWVDEIVVLDSGSTDRTVEIARRYTPHVEVTDWPGFGVQKQRALERARSDWVLSIDADEVVTAELRHDIDVVLSRVPAEVGFRVPWAVTVYGKRLDFGRSARAPLRLFRREGARFSDDIVHEKVLLPPGPVGVLRGRLLHYSLRDYRHALQKSAEYAWLGAQKRHHNGRHGGGLLIATLRAAWVFLQIYVLRLGFLDGPVGYLVAITYAQGAFSKYAGLWTLRRQAARERALTIQGRQ